MANSLGFGDGRGATSKVALPLDRSIRFQLIREKCLLAGIGRAVNLAQ